MRIRNLATAVLLVLASVSATAFESATAETQTVVPYLKGWSCTFATCRTTGDAAGREVTFVLPGGVNRILVTLIGGPGWYLDGQPGPPGDVVSGYLDVVGGQTLRVKVGRTGSSSDPGFNLGKSEIGWDGVTYAAAAGFGGNSIVPPGGTSRQATVDEIPGVTITRADRLPPAGSTLVKLVQKASGKCATATVTDPRNRSTWFGLPSTLGDCATSGVTFSSEAGKQAFRMAHESGRADDIYRFQNAEICQGNWGDAGWWDTANAKSDNGTDVVSGDYAYWNAWSDASHQLWRVIPVQEEPGWVRIQQVSSGRFLDSDYAHTVSGTHLVIGNLTVSDSQKWSLVAA
jgi:hypothetical protein